MHYRSGTINIQNVFSHITVQKGVCDFPYVVWLLFYNLLKFDILNADVPFCRIGHNLETEAKLNKARHPFSNKVSLNVGADFQLIRLQDACKWTKNFHPYMQFYFIQKKTKNISWDCCDWVLKSPPHWQVSAWVSLPQQWLMTTWNKQTSTILAQKSTAVLWHCYRSKDKIPKTLERFICKLLWFLLSRRFCRQNWYYVPQLYTSSISRYFL